ncbi:MAG: hypothetical protein EBR82_34055 [Caulobacteraceae bacterium]|nr:hypothetical protein [Caulobacteraceae bacterium]
MSLNGSVVTVGTSATVIATGKVGASWIYLHALTGGNAIFIGPSTVTTANGLELPKGALQTFWLAETDVLYGIVATSTQALMVMQSGGR